MCCMCVCRKWSYCQLGNSSSPFFCGLFCADCAPGEYSSESLPSILPSQSLVVQAQPICDYSQRALVARMLCPQSVLLLSIPYVPDTAVYGSVAWPPSCGGQRYRWKPDDLIKSLVLWDYLSCGWPLWVDAQCLIESSVADWRPWSVIVYKCGTLLSFPSLVSIPISSFFLLLPASFPICSFCVSRKLLPLTVSATAIPIML